MRTAEAAEAAGLLIFFVTNKPLIVKPPRLMSPKPPGP